jgi:hypothetical protein
MKGDIYRMREKRHIGLFPGTSVVRGRPIPPERILRTKSK